VIHLDTSFLIRALVPGSPQDRTLREWLGDRTALGISAVAWAEFLCGPMSGRARALAERVVGPAVPFGPEEAVLAAELSNGAGRRRGTLADCMIAATALRAEAHLATADPRDYAPFAAAGLTVTG
jgi:predicted nucleic acid-binding protein